MLGNNLCFSQLVSPLPCYSMKHKQDWLVVTASLTQQETTEQCKIHNRCKVRPSPSCEFAGWEAAVLENPFISLPGSKSSSIVLSQGTSAGFCGCTWSNAIWPRWEMKNGIFFSLRVLRHSKKGKGSTNKSAPQKVFFKALPDHCWPRTTKPSSS